MGSGHLLALSLALSSTRLGARVSGPLPIHGPSFCFHLFLRPKCLHFCYVQATVSGVEEGADGLREENNPR